MNRTYLFIIAILAALLSPVNTHAEVWDPVKIDGIYYNLPSSPTGKAMVVAPYGYKYTGDLTIPSAISYEGQQYDVDGLLYVLTAADISSLTLSEGFTNINLSVQNAAKLSSVTLPSTTAKNSKISCGLGSHRLVNVNIRTDKGKITLILDKFGIFGSDGQALEAFLAAGPNSPKIEFDGEGHITFDSADAESYGCVQQADSYVINLYCEIDGKRIHVRTQSSPNHSGMSATADGINYMVTERGAAVVMNQEAPYTGRISVAQSIEYGDDSHDVTIIDDNAFNNFYGSDISSIELPRTLVEIGYAAFSNSENLEGITIPDGVTTIKAYAFSGCHSMTYAKLPSGLETLGKNAFKGCTSLNSLEIPAGAAMHNTFDGCDNLCRVEVLGASSTDVRLELSSNLYLNGGGNIPLCVYTMRYDESGKLVLNKIHRPENGIVEIPLAELYRNNSRSGQAYSGEIHVYCDNTDSELFPAINPGDSEPYSFASFEIPQPSISGISAPAPVDTASETEYYNLNGIRLGSRPSVPGIYICRDCAGTSKIIIR